MSKSRHKRHIKNLAYMALRGFDPESVMYCHGLVEWSKSRGSIRKSPSGNGFLFRHMMMNLWTSTPPISDWGYGDVSIYELSHFMPTFVFSKAGTSFEVVSWKGLSHMICGLKNLDALKERKDD